MNPIDYQNYLGYHNQNKKSDLLLRDLIEIYGDSKPWRKIAFLAKKDCLADEFEISFIEKYHPELNSFHHKISEVKILYQY